MDSLPARTLSSAYDHVIAVHLAVHDGIDERGRLGHAQREALLRKAAHARADSLSQRGRVHFSFLLRRART